MFAWFKRRQNDPDIRSFAEKLLGPPALAAALAETVRDYVAAVQAGRLTYPAHRRKGASVVEVWADLRIEALHKLFNYGKAEPFLLADTRHQTELLVCFLDERAHLEMPQPHGAIIPDTIQAMWQVYLYLDGIGTEVADRETDRIGLKLERRSILDRIEADCTNLREQLVAHKTGVRDATIPPVIIELLYRDVTAKAKSIALSAKFGPHYESGISFFENQLIKQGDDPTAFRNTVQQLMEATDPDHFD